MRDYFRTADLFRIGGERYFLKGVLAVIRGIAFLVSRLPSFLCVATLESDWRGLNDISMLNSKKLLHSKWTAVTPQRKEKHFVINAVERNDAGAIVHCTIEAVISKQTYAIAWRDLQDTQQWRQGWS